MATFVFVGALFGIIGTIHSMIWSISTLFLDVLSKAKSKTIKDLLRTNVINERSSIIFMAGVIFLISYFLPGLTIVKITVSLIVTSYIL